VFRRLADVTTGRRHGAIDLDKAVDPIAVDRFEPDPIPALGHSIDF
jgi:hypothetical protein